MYMCIYMLYLQQNMLASKPTSNQRNPYRVLTTVLAHIMDSTVY